MNLKTLKSRARSRLGVSFLSGTYVDMSDLESDYPRPVELDALADVLRAARDRFTGGNRAESDAWLGPRVHSSLRLSKREAADPLVWLYLGVVPFRDYVRWRFETQGKVDVGRFSGTYKHALARLWWMAELFRDGPDYTPVRLALSNQDVPNNLFRMDIAHHRPTVQGAVRVLFPGFPDDANGLTGRQANALAKAANTAAVTLRLDLLAPDVQIDGVARGAWVEAGPPREVAWWKAEASGPDEERVPTPSVEVMTDLLSDLMAGAPVRGQDAAAPG